jgi:hypothetical protein
MFGAYVSLWGRRQAQVHWALALLAAALTAPCHLRPPAHPHLVRNLQDSYIIVLSKPGYCHLLLSQTCRIICAAGQQVRGMCLPVISTVTSRGTFSYSNTAERES